MIRRKKILFLIEKGEDIKYHFLYFTKQKRLIIDSIYDKEKDICYSFFNTTGNQNIANKLIDELFDKYTGGGNYDK